MNNNIYVTFAPSCIIACYISTCLREVSDFIVSICRSFDLFRTLLDQSFLKCPNTLAAMCIMHESLSRALCIEKYTHYTLKNYRASNAHDFNTFSTEKLNSLRDFPTILYWSENRLALSVFKTLQTECQRSTQKLVYKICICGCVKSLAVREKLRIH